jgi:hypothetical protein
MISKLQRDLRCVKYEMKRLKTEQRAKSQSPELTIGTTKTELTLISRLQSDLRCLKYEMKKLKTEQMSTKSLADEVRELAETAQTTAVNAERCASTAEVAAVASQVAISWIQPLLNSAITPSTNECNLVNAEEIWNSIRSLTSDVSNLQADLSSLCFIQDDIDSMKENFGELSNSIRSVETCGVSLSNMIQNICHAIRCLKHEMKKLKLEMSAHDLEIDSVRNLTKSLTQDTDFLKHEFSVIQSSTGSCSLMNDEFLQFDSDALRRELRCVKHELRKLKIRGTTRSGGRLGAEIRELKREMIQTIEVPDTDHDRFARDIRCLKHEVRAAKLAAGRCTQEARIDRGIMRVVEEKVIEIESLKNEFQQAMESENLLSVVGEKMRAQLEGMMSGIRKEIEEIRDQLSISKGVSDLPKDTIGGPNMQLT